MPEVSFAPATSANADYHVGDATYVAGEIVDWDDATLRVGRDDAKTPVNRGAVAHYDTSSIPLGSTINKVKLEVRSTHTNTNSFTADFGYMSLNSKLDQTTVSYHDAQFIYYPDYAIFPAASLWDNGRFSGSNKTIEMPLNIEHGVGSVGQVWTCDVNNQDLQYQYWYLKRTGSLSSTTVYTNIYEVDGSDGSYTKGTLVNDGSGQARSANLINSSTLTAFYFRPEGDTSWTPTYQQKYLSELVFTGGSGSSSISVGILTTADGSVENANVYARQTPTPARVLQGFGGYTQFLSASDIRLASVNATDSISMPSFSTTNTVYRFGSSEYNSETNFTLLPNIKSSVASILGSRSSTSQWLGLRIQDFTGTTNGRERRFQSSRNSSATVGSLKGPVLTIDYTVVEPNLYARLTSAGLVEGLTKTEDRLSAKQSSSGLLAVSSAKLASRIKAKTSTDARLTGTIKTRKGN